MDVAAVPLHRAGMDPVGALTRLGGTADTAALLDLTSRTRLRRAVERGDVRRTHRGRYALPDADRARRAASRVNGVLALRSAAMQHGWAVKSPPLLPEVAVPRKRHVSPHQGLRLVWMADLDTSLIATPALQTVIACARMVPFDEALAIADSALRAGDITRTELLEAGDAVRGAGAARVRRVARHATTLAANPFESVLRAIVIDIGLEPIVQHPIDVGEREIHPDLVIGRLVIEADSWEWHTGKRAHDRDCWRYNALVVRGWTVLRFSWEQVMLDPSYVRDTILAMVQGPQPQAEVADPWSYSA